MGVIDKLWALLGVQNEEIREEIIEMPVDDNDTGSSRKGANLVSIHTNKAMKVVVCEAESFDEVQVLADHLKNRRQVIINFDNTPPEASQRIIDFLSGTTYSLEGNSQQLGKNIFLFAPSNVEISQDHRSILKRNGSHFPFGGDK